MLLVCMLILSLAACPNTLAEASGDALEWWQKTSVYEVYVNSFQDTDGNGYGDIQGVTRHLDHLKSLGVGAIWLTPVFVSPMEDNGYDVADYYTINPLYGSNEDMDTLIEEAGQRGIRIVMDLVYNHTSDQHEWFRESMQSRDNAYSDWYIRRDGKPDGVDGMSDVHAMTVNTPGILDFLHEFRQQVQDGTDIFTVGEANGVGPDDLSDWVGSDGVFDMIFSFDHLVDGDN